MPVVQSPETEVSQPHIRLPLQFSVNGATPTQIHDRIIEVLVNVTDDSVDRIDFDIIKAVPTEWDISGLGVAEWEAEVVAFVYYTNESEVELEEFSGDETDSI